MGRWALLNGLLGVIVLLLGLQIAWTWSRTLPSVDVEERGDSNNEPTPLPGDGPKGERRSRRNADRAPASPAVLVNTIHHKDLFDPSRQKASEEVKVAAPKETGPPPSLTLSGVRILGKDREAFITDTTAPAGQQLKRMRSGDQVSGYSVKSIEPTRVTLTSSSGDVIKLKLEVEKTGGGAATPGAPGVPGVAGRPPRPGPPGAPGVPGQPGQPGGAAAPSPAAGIQPTPPAGAGQVRPPRAGMQARQGAPGAPGAATPPGTPPVPGQPNQQVPQLPAGVREKLEQLKSN